MASYLRLGYFSYWKYSYFPRCSGSTKKMPPGRVSSYGRLSVLSAFPRDDATVRWPWLHWRKTNLVCIAYGWVTSDAIYVRCPWVLHCWWLTHKWPLWPREYIHETVSMVNPLDEVSPDFLCNDNKTVIIFTLRSATPCNNPLRGAWE